jgi:hypothetical protein
MLVLLAAATVVPVMVLEGMLGDGSLASSTLVVAGNLELVLSALLLYLAHAITGRGLLRLLGVMGLIVVILAAIGLVLESHNLSAALILQTVVIAILGGLLVVLVWRRTRPKEQTAAASPVCRMIPVAMCVLLTLLCSIVAGYLPLRMLEGHYAREFMADLMTANRTVLRLDDLRTWVIYEGGKL